MKTPKLILVGSILASWLAIGAAAQFGPATHIRDIRGDPVIGTDGAKVGAVRDLAVDLENGRIVAVIVDRGGFLGFGAKCFAVPPDDFTVDNSAKSLRMSSTAEKLKGGPQMDLSKWDDSVAQPRVEEVYQYYGMTPYFLVPEHPAKKAGKVVLEHLGKVQRAGDLLGMETINRQDEKLGKVDDMILDYAQGRIIEMTLATGSYLDKPGNLNPVPPQALHFDSARNMLVLDATRSELMVAPRFPEKEQPVIDRGQATAVYQTYHVLPYFLPIGATTTLTAPSGKTKVARLPEQGTSESDQDITAKIEKEIRDTEELSVDAKAAKVITTNGHVTLTGTADSPEEKRRMSEIVGRIVPPASIDNRLEIKSATASAGT